MSFGPPPSPYTQSALTAEQNRRRRRNRLLGGLALFGILTLGVSGWFVSSAGDDSAPAGKTAIRQDPYAIRETVEKPPTSPEGQRMIDHVVKDLPKGTNKSRYAPGTWATDKILARGVADRIEGYKIKPEYDEKAWTLKLDGHLCATSRHVTANGRTAVVVQPAKPENSTTKGVCDEVVFFDLNTGKKLWQHKMPAADFAYVTNTNLTLTDGVVAIAWGHGSVAYDMRRGKQLWNSTTTATCQDQGYAGGRALLALVACKQGENTLYKVQKLDPRTGKPQWTYKVPKGIQAVYLPSSDPPVLAIAAGDTLVTDLITLDAQGRHLATISLDDYDPKCGDRYSDMSFFGVTENCDGVVVGRSQVYVVSKESIEPNQASDWITAFDLRTGRTAGKFEGRDIQTVYPLRMSGDELLIYRQGLYPYALAALVSWNPHTGKQTPLLFFDLPDDEDTKLGDPEQTDIIVEKGRIFFGRRELARNIAHPDDAVHSAIGFGSVGLKH
ncbi:PQQ-binding-like beta-propeller repeat protein [Streptomyces echinoruber]|uniref:Pyrrolo-quinoline quinone repeat domain-containing protein n=1 Tax=Streptomyces echinoruber TaxID=68898 RepID=A0A918RYV3_9ACTN|nr:PQQ-binding-like beta-propeller repeat protein [Streptomyces echinoruber]GHA14000.1 hypothetical protein GCM10010389_61010 [Streptomyces echinoruber]